MAVMDSLRTATPEAITSSRSRVAFAAYHVPLFLAVVIAFILIPLEDIRAHKSSQAQEDR